MVNGIKYFFNSESLVLTLYLVIGFFLSHFSHIYVYRSRKGKTLMTWFKQIKLIEKEPSIKLVIILCLFLYLIQFSIIQLTIPLATEASLLKIFNVGILYLIIFSIISQLIFSSIMRLSYELLICAIIIFSIILSKTFIHSDVYTIEKYRELWDIIKFITPFCIGIPILMGSVGFITSFYQKEQSVIRLQLYRHVLMTIYFVIGTLSLIVYPIVKEILIVREKLF